MSLTRRQWIAAVCNLCWMGVALPAVARGGPEGSTASSTDRTQVFVVAMSEDLAHQAGVVTQALRRVMRSRKGLEVQDLREKLQPPAPPKIRALQEKARRNLKRAKEALRDMELVAAGEHADQARAAFEKMGGYLGPLQRYKESILMVAVGACMQGNTDKCKEGFLDLLLLDPHLRLHKSAYDAFVIDVFKQVKAKLDKMPRGSLSIKTEPPGGSLYLDGTLRGVTPDALDGLVAGRHLVVVRHPGYKIWGKVVQVEPGNLVSLHVKLLPGASGTGFVQMVERAGRAVSDDELRGEVLRLGQALGLDWVWLCQLKHDEYDLVLDGYLFEFSHAKVIHHDSLRMASGGYGMEEEVRRYARTFMDEGLRALTRFRRKGDPLKARSGTEDWYRDRTPAAPRHRTQSADEEPEEEESGDPLDEIDGTEDW